MSDPVRNIRLDSVARILAGGKSGLTGNHFVDSGYPAFGAGGLNGFLPEFEFEDGAIILSSIGARCGKCFYPVGKWASLANTQLIFPNPELVDRKFLWYQLNDESLWHRSGTAQPYIKPSDVKGQLVSLPPLPEQRRIADILDRADGLRAQRRRALRLVELGVDALFLEAFGDVVANERAWPRGKVSDLVARFTSGKSVVGSDDGDSNGRPRVLKISAVTSGRFIPSESKPLPVGYSPPESHFVADGDLLISRANTSELVGATARVSNLETRSVLPDKIWKFVWPETLTATPTFVWKMFGRPEFRRAISEIATGSSGSMKNISQSAVLNLPAICPPLDLQLRFSEQVDLLDEVADRGRLHLTKLDELFASLQHRAFQGEL